MIIARLSIIAVSAAAIMFSGCSTDNRITGTGSNLGTETNNDLPLLASDTQNLGSSGRVAVGNNNSDKGPERFSIVARVKSLDIENGCWYLEADDGETYTPVVPKGLILENDLSLKALGYIDKDIQFFCGDGPAFVIEKYEILERPKDSDTERYSGIKTGNGSLSEMAVVNGFSEDRAPSRATEERSPQDMRDRASEAKKKYEEERKSIERSRDESARTMGDNDRFSESSDAAPPNNNQMQRQQEEKKKYEVEWKSTEGSRYDSARTMGGDNDRFSEPSDTAPPNNNQMQNQQEEKKKYEEDQKFKDYSTDRP